LHVAEAGDPFGRGCGRDPLAGEAGADPERDREMGLAGTGRAEQHDVVFVGEDVDPAHAAVRICGLRSGTAGSRARLCRAQPQEPDWAEKLTEWASEHGVVCLPDHESVPDADFLAFSCSYDRILDRNELADAAERARCSYILRPGFRATRRPIQGETRRVGGELTRVPFTPLPLISDGLGPLHVSLRGSCVERNG
jgi:hypothetical protein